MKRFKVACIYMLFALSFISTKSVFASSIQGLSDRIENHKYMVRQNDTKLITLNKSLQSYLSGQMGDDQASQAKLNNIAQRVEEIKASNARIKTSIAKIQKKIGMKIKMDSINLARNKRMNAQKRKRQANI